MSSVIKKGLAGSVLLFMGYLACWPVAVDPVAWQAPINPGYNGDFSPNQALSKITRIELQNEIGPEDLALSKDGHVYFALLSGAIKFLDANGNIQPWVNTGGRPLGIEFDQQGNLHIKRQSGEDLIYPVNAIGAIEQRVKSEIEKSKVDKSPKVYTEKQYNDMGAEVGERAYIVSQDPKTGQQYKQYIEERPENQITPQEEIQTAIDMVRNNEITPQQFKSWYGFDAPVTGNTTARPAADDEFSDGDIARRPSSGFGLNQF